MPPCYYGIAFVIRNYQLLLDIFREYSAAGTNSDDPFTLQFDSFMQICDDAEIAHSSELFCKRRDCEAIFGVVNHLEGSWQSSQLTRYAYHSCGDRCSLLRIGDHVSQGCF